MRRAAALAFAVALLPAAALSQSQKSPRELVVGQLDAAPKMISGLLNTYGEFWGELPKGGAAKHKFTTSADKDQAVQLVGACDAGCGTLDVKLRDDGGALVAEVLLADAYPIVYAETEPKTAYEVEVSMTDCREAACLYAVRAWRKNRLKGAND